MGVGEPSSKTFGSFAARNRVGGSGRPHEQSWGGGIRVLASHGSSLSRAAPWMVEPYPPRCIWWQRREPRREVRPHRHCLDLPPMSSVTGDQRNELQGRCPSEASKSTEAHRPCLHG